MSDGQNNNGNKTSVLIKVLIAVIGLAAVSAIAVVIIAVVFVRKMNSSNETTESGNVTTTTIEVTDRETEDESTEAGSTEEESQTTENQNDAEENRKKLEENTLAAYKAYLAELEDNYDEYSVVISGYPLNGSQSEKLQKTVAIGDFWGDEVPEMVAVKRTKTGGYTDDNGNPLEWYADVLFWSYDPESGKIVNWDINGSDEGEGQLWAMTGGVGPWFPIDRIFRNTDGKGLIIYSFQPNETGGEGFSFNEKLCTVADDGSSKPVINSSAAAAILDYNDPAKYYIADNAVSYEDFKTKTDEMLSSYKEVLLTNYDSLSSFRGTDPEPDAISSDHFLDEQNVSSDSYTAPDAVKFLKTALGQDVSDLKLSVPVDSLPDMASLQTFTKYASQIKKYDSDTGEFDSLMGDNIIDSMLRCYGTISIPGDWHSLKWDNTESDGFTYYDGITDPRSWWVPSNGEIYGYYECDAEKVDWMVKNIAHADPDKIPEVLSFLDGVGRAYKDVGEDGKSYYYFPMTFGGEYYTKITSAEYDGQYYYITYDEITSYGDETEYTCHAVMGYEEIDGKSYWTLYSQTTE